MAEGRTLQPQTLTVGFTGSGHDIEMDADCIITGVGKTLEKYKDVIGTEYTIVVPGLHVLGYQLDTRPYHQFKLKYGV